MANEYNWGDNNPEKYPQRPRGGLTSDQAANVWRSECYYLRANGLPISIRDFDYMRFVEMSNARSTSEQEHLRDQLGQLDDRRRSILGQEEERRCQKMSR